MQDLAIDFIDLLRFGGDLHLQSRGGFIHQIDGLIRQKSVGDVAAAEHGGSHQCAVGDANAMVHFIAFLQSAQDRDRVLHRGLVDQHLLEATLKSWILFDVLTVFVECCGSDTAQFASGQHRFEQVAGIHGATSGAGPNHRVDLIDEQNDLSFGVSDLLENRFEPFLEFAAIFGPGDQGPHVEGDELSVLQRLRNIAVDDALSEAFDNGGLADARFADQHRVVLGSAAEDLNGAADLLVAADHRIKLAVAGCRREITSVFL